MKTLSIVLAVTLTSVALSAQAPDRTKPPVSGPTPALTLPQIQKRQLSNGLAVWIVELHEVPVVQINLVVTNGTTGEAKGKFGIGSLTAAMLTEGAGARNALAIADATDFLGADLTSTIGFDSWAVRLHVPVSRLADALPIMSDVALRPTFPADELERLRQQRLTSLVQARDEPSTIASLAISRVLYREGRFGTAAMGTASNIRGFTVDDLRGFYAAQFVPSKAALLVVGDIPPGTVMPLLERHFGGWKIAVPPDSVSGGVRSGAISNTFGDPNGPARASREVYLVDKPGAPQSQIRIGLIGARRSTPDYFPLQVMNTILGGSFSSRLNMNLREQHGYTYGASSSFDMRATPGPFIASAGVQTDKTSESLTEFFKELNGIQQLVPPEELTRARHYVSLRYPGGFETTGDISRRLEDALVYGLPANYFSKYVPAIESVSAADVQRVARAHIPVSTLAIVVVGDRKVIEPGIRALNLGPVSILSLDQVFENSEITK